MSSVELRGLTKRFGSQTVLDRVSLTVAARPADMPARALGLRQDHGAAPDRGLHGADRGRDRDRRAHRVEPGAHAAARAAQRVDGVPELRAVAAHDGGRERRLRPQAAQARPRRHRRQGRGDPFHHAACARWPSATRPSCRAASSSACRSPGRWSWSPRRCCSTSRCRTSTPTCARRCASRSAACTTPTATRRSTSPTTRARR